MTHSELNQTELAKTAKSEISAAKHSSEAALKLTNLVKRYGQKTAVNNLSLTVEPGCVLAFLGPNGAGKTTTIEICEGFIKPTSGSVEVLGLDPTQHPDEVRRRIGIMLQGGGSYPGIRVREALNLAASYSQNPLDPAWLLDILGLSNVANTSYRRLSGGQQQRLSLAIALVGRPELVFLDEPTAGLDTQSRLLVWKLIQALKNDGVTVVLTTHLMDEAQALADTIAIIDHGSLVAAGSLTQLRTLVPDTQLLKIETDTPLDVDSLATELGISVEAERPLHYSVHTHPTPDLIKDLSAYAANNNVLITAMSTQSRSLEDIFLDLTGRNLRS